MREYRSARVLVIDADRYSVVMTNTSQEWRRRSPKGMNAVAYARPCGWHVILSQTGDSMSSVLKPIVIGKSCVPYKVHADTADAQDQVEALGIGVCNIASHAPETCNNL